MMPTSSASRSPSVSGDGGEGLPSVAVLPGTSPVRPACARTRRAAVALSPRACKLRKCVRVTTTSQNTGAVCHYALKSKADVAMCASGAAPSTTHSVTANPHATATTRRPSKNATGAGRPDAAKLVRPSWPSLPRPHVHKRPRSSMAALWAAPAATAVIRVPRNAWNCAMADTNEEELQVSDKRSCETEN